MLSNPDELHHLRHVLRLGKGADIYLFNGRGKEARATVLSVKARGVVARLEKVNDLTPRRPRLILACAVPKKSKFELIIEKATELGADEIIPMNTRRTELKYNTERMHKKLTRYQTVALNATKQSQQAFIPVLYPVSNFPDVLRKLTQISSVLIPSLSGPTEPLFAALQKIKMAETVSVLIGPEGDFTQEEYTKARESGCIPVSLGTTVLKVETAAICALSCAQLFFRA